MTTLAPPAPTRATPRKLGPPPRQDARARDNYTRQLDYLVAGSTLSVSDRDFLAAALFAYSDKAAKDFYPSQATMSELRRCSVRTVQRRVAAAKAAGVLLVAQLKGFDKATSSWYCSTNTYRPTFVAEWVAKLAEAREARRAAARAQRIAARATRPAPARGAPVDGPPPPPDFDEAELERQRAEAVPPGEVRERAAALRAALHPTRPPPS